MAKQEDKALRSYSVSLLEQGSTNTEVLEETSELSKEAEDISLATDDNNLTVHVNTKALNGDLATGEMYKIISITLS